MFVRVIVPIEDTHPDKSWMECCGGLVQVQIDETPIFGEALEKTPVAEDVRRQRKAPRRLRAERPPLGALHGRDHPGFDRLGRLV